MKFILNRINRKDEGFTLVELMLAMLLTSMLALGAMKLLGAGVTSMQYNQTVALTGSSSSNLNAVFTRDIAETNGFIVPTATGVDSVSTVTGDGTYATYTFSGNNTLAAGENITISGILKSDGVTTSGFNAVNATVISADMTAKTFVIANTTQETVKANSGALSVTCSTWSPSDTNYSQVRPLLTLSQQKSITVTAATGNGTIATYTYSGADDLTPGQGISVSGLTSAPAGAPTQLSGSLNFINQPIISVDSAANTFSVASTSNEIASTQGTASFNIFVGYEVHTNNGAGEIWRVQCFSPATTKANANSQYLRGGLPISSDSSWSNAITCSTFTNGATSSATCPANAFLNSITNYPGITFLIPASTAVQSSTGLTQYASQVILGARSIS